MPSFVSRLGLISVTGLGLAMTAQIAQAQDLRYLSWTGKPQQAAPQTGPQASAPQGYGQQPQSVRYPSMASMGRPSRYSPSVASGGLTPADAWFSPTQPRPQPTASAPHPSYGPQPYSGPAAPPQAQQNLPLPAYALPAQHRTPTPSPAYAPAPVMAMSARAATPNRPTYQPAPPPAPVTPPTTYASPPAAWTQPGYAPQVYSGLPNSQIPIQQSPSPVVSGPAWASPQPAATGAPVADPMAPRRDAPIFSIQTARDASQVSPAPQGSPSPAHAQPFPTVSASPPREGARYYSVHRQAGRDPDPAQIPESVYAVIPEGAFLDAARPDLADPPPAPVATRTINGRIQAINRGDDPSLP